MTFAVICELTQEQVDFVLSPSAAYNVDIMHSKSAEIMAANKCVETKSMKLSRFSLLYLSAVRGILMAIITTGILPSINTIGVLYTNLISALLAWMGAV